MTEFGVVVIGFAACVLLALALACGIAFFRRRKCRKRRTYAFRRPYDLRHAQVWEPDTKRWRFIGEDDVR